MEPAPGNVGQFVETSKRFARRLLAIGENRFQLLMVEAQEARERLLRDWQNLPDTLDQLRKDRACLEKHLT